MRLQGRAVVVAAVPEAEVAGAVEVEAEVAGAVEVEAEVAGAVEVEAEAARFSCASIHSATS